MAGFDQCGLSNHERGLARIHVHTILKVFLVQSVTLRMCFFHLAICWHESGSYRGGGGGVSGTVHEPQKNGESNKIFVSRITKTRK